MIKLFKRIIGNWWVVRRSCWPYPAGYVTYNKFKKTMLDFVPTLEQALELCMTFGKVAVSGYDHPLMNKFFKSGKWFKTIGRDKTIHSTKDTRQEVLWSNYNPENQSSIFANDSQTTNTRGNITRHICPCGCRTKESGYIRPGNSGTG